MTPGSLLYVTEVAPYASTHPAGAHGVLPQSVVAIAELASMVGLSFETTGDVGSLSLDTLAKARVLALFTIGETPWSPDQKRLILERVSAGQMGLLALHSTTDSCYEWPEFGSLVGARFDGHPWTQEFPVEVVDADHPATRHLKPIWPTTDELYLFRELRPDARILLRTDGSDLDMAAPGAKRPEIGFPLAWCFTEGAGRVFYTALGHFPTAYESVAFLGHLHGGLTWLLEVGG